MLGRAGYLEEYVAFWSARPEVNHIWVSTYTPQVGENSPEMLSADDREAVARRLLPLRPSYPKLLMTEGLAASIRRPPEDPDACIFFRMSINYSADLRSRVEPCIFGGTPDCSQCGCVASTGMHWLGNITLAGPLRIGHLVESSIGVGRLINRLRSKGASPERWKPGTPASGAKPGLVQIRL
jgi:hypothetical protein